MIYRERLRLRAPERTDIPLFHEWLNDEEVTANLATYLPLSLADEEAWFESMIKRPPDEHPMVIEIQEADGWKPVGNCGFRNLQSRSRSGEVGIFIGVKSCWNHGYGTEAMRLLLRHGFLTLNLNRIFLAVYETNARAIRSYENAGFTHEGRMRQAEYKNGRYSDILLMSVLRSEWDQAGPKGGE